MLYAGTASTPLIVFYVPDASSDRKLFGVRGMLLASALSATGVRVALIFPAARNQVELCLTDGQLCRSTAFAHFADLLTTLARLEGPHNIFVSCSAANIDVFGAVHRLKSSGWKTVYDIEYDVEDMHRLKLISSYHFEVESMIVKLVDRVTVSSHRLLNKAICFGVNPSKFSLIPNSNINGSYQLEMEQIEGKVHASHAANSVVGYLGSLDPAWFDWPLVLSIINKFPKLNFHFIGYNVPCRLKIPANLTIECIDRVAGDYQSIISKWQIGLIAWRKSPASLSINPLILHSYLWMGVTAITSPLGCRHNNPYIYEYSNEDEFCRCLTKVLTRRVSYSDRASLIDFLTRFNWQTSALSFMKCVNENFE